MAALCDPQFTPSDQILEFTVVPAANINDHLEAVKLHLVVKASLSSLVIGLIGYLVIFRLLRLFENNVHVGEVKTAGRLAERSCSFFLLILRSPYHMRMFYYRHLYYK